MPKLISFIAVVFVSLFLILNCSLLAVRAEAADTIPPVITNISITPNPFNPTNGPCKFSYTTSDNLSQKLHVVINISNVDNPNLHPNVAVIIRDGQPIGNNVVLWEGYDTWDGTKQDYGKLLASGKYVLHGYISDEAGNKTFFPPPNTTGGYPITLDTNIAETAVDKSIHKGWPKVLAESPLSASATPVLHDLDNDGKKELIVCGNIFKGGVPAIEAYVFREDGSVYPGWPVEIVNEGQMFSAVAVGDVSGDKRPEIVILASWGNLYVFSEDGRMISGLSPLRLPQGKFNAIRETPVLFDFDNDGKKEIIVKCFDNISGMDKIYVVKGSGDYLYRCEGAKNDFFLQPAVGFIEKKVHLFCISVKGYLYVWDDNGNLLSGYPKNAGTSKQELSIVNISMEKSYLFFGGNSLSGIDSEGNAFGHWPFIKNNSSIFSSPAFLKANGKIYVFTKLNNFHFEDYGYWGEGNTQVTDSIELYLFDLTGNLIKGWPKVFTDTTGMKDKYLGPATIAVSGDVDKDGNEDIIIGNQYFNELHAFKIDGTEIPGWPKKLSIGAKNILTAAVDDIDADGNIEIAAVAQQENVSKNSLGQLVYSWPFSQIFVWDAESLQKTDGLTWPQYRHDAAHTGLYAPSYKEKREAPPIPGTPDFGDLSRDSRLWGRYSLSWREAADDHETGFRDYWNYVLSLSEEDQYGGYQYSDSDEEEGLDLLKGYWDSYLERLDDLLADLKEYEVYRNGEYVASVMRPSYLEPGGLPEGQYNYHVKAIDRHGNASEPSGVSSSIIIDRTPPVIKNIGAPRQFDPEKELCKISYATSDNLAKELFVLLEVSQKPKKDEPPLVARRIIQNFQPAGINYLFWDGRDDSGNFLERGEYSFKFYVSDETGINLDNIDRMTTAVSEEQAIRLHRDERKKKEIPQVKTPEIVVLSPENNFLTNVSFVTVNYTVDGTAKYNDFSLQEGENTLTVSGTNSQGLSASKSINVSRDSRPPQLIINSPLDNFITEDPHISIEYTVDGEAKFRDYELQEGVNIITVQETDGAGNTGFASISGALKSKAQEEFQPPQEVKNEETPVAQPPQEGSMESSNPQVQVQPQPEPVVKGVAQSPKIIKPKAIMITVPRAGYAPLEVRFFGDRSYGRGGARIVSHLWNFGDGAISEEINPVHVFEQNPLRYLTVYKVTLTVIDDKGVSATARTKVRVLKELKK